MIQWFVFRSRRSVIRWILVQSGFHRPLIWKWICSKGTPQIRNPDPDSPKGTHIVKQESMLWISKLLFHWYLLIISEKSFLSHKLRCYAGISGPEKSRNNTREKISYFFTCVDIANQLLTRHSPLAPLGQVDEWTAKFSRLSIQGSLLELSRIVAAKILTNPYRWKTVKFELS